MESVVRYYESWNDGAYKIVDNWFFMKHPIIIIGTVFTYLMLVLKIGPAFMKNRKPMELKEIIVLYNFVQIPFSAYLVYKMVISGVYSRLFNDDSADCPENGITKEPDIPFLEATWWYHIGKISELLETVFFVLRKKFNQVSFLHLYHHTVMSFFSWFYLKYQPSEIGGVMSAINSVVHVIMYTYYMIAALGPAYQKYIWWKKYMTAIQLIQFMILMSLLIMKMMSKCGISRELLYFFIVQDTVFLYLFFDFYFKSYKEKSKIKNQQKSNSNGITATNGNSKTEKSQ